MDEPLGIKARTMRCTVGPFWALRVLCDPQTVYWRYNLVACPASPSVAENGRLFFQFVDLSEER